MDEQSDGERAGKFYDSVRGPGPSSAALAHGRAYVGQECLLTPDEILAFARRAGIAADTWVLDVGSGVGGPACHLAQHLGCRVLGIDPSAVGHARAVQRAHDGGLGHLVEFRLGDIHDVVLPDAAFDVVLGLDAWCHIPRRADLLQRCRTLLRPGGRVAFYDHVERRRLPEHERERFFALWRFPGLETPRSYLAAVEAAGLRLLYHEETAALAERFYSRLLEAYRQHRVEFGAARGAERYREGLERLEMSQRFAAGGALGQLACIAENPGPADGAELNEAGGAALRAP